jgi:hypothetical protein
VLRLTTLLSTPFFWFGWSVHASCCEEVKAFCYVLFRVVFISGFGLMLYGWCGVMIGICMYVCMYVRYEERKTETWVIR